MSRSYKKTPGFVDNTNKIAKKYANKKVRKNWNISNGSSYKKLFCSYEIKDWKFLLFTKEDVIACREEIYKAFMK